jgi:hypothetical protein
MLQLRRRFPQTKVFVADHRSNRGEFTLKKYFNESLRVSVVFVTTTILLVAFLVWAFRVERSMEILRSCGSGTVLELSVAPILAWVYALILHAEIRNITKADGNLPSNSRLVQLHQSLVLMAILFSWPFCSRHLQFKD